MVIGLSGVQFGLQSYKSCYQLIIKNYNFRDKKNSQVRKERENWHNSGYQSHAIFSAKVSRQNLSFGGRQSSPPP